MTEPIREKFEGLDASMAARHNALMDKLDELVLPGTEPIDYSAAFASLGNKLDALVLAVSGLHSALTGPEGELRVWRAAQQANFDALLLASGTLTSISADLATLKNIVSGNIDARLVNLIANTSTANSIAGNLYGMLSAIASPWPTDVLAAIQCVCDATQALQPPDPLDPDTGLTCSQPYTSTGQRIVPLQLTNWSGNVIYATWSEPLPPGIEYGTVLGLDLDEGTISAADWSGWTVFVQSEEQQFGWDPFSLERFPTNTVIQMSGSGNRTFSVSERGSIKVYLCSPGDGGGATIPEGECADHVPTGQNDDSYIIEIPAYPADYTMMFSTAATVVDANGVEHFLNYGIQWHQEDTGPGPWTVYIGDPANPNEVVVAIVCNPGPV